MNHITELRIEGFKKFKSINISFNEKKNIIIGENEAGKSSIIEAISIVLNQKYKNSDKSVLKDLFNRECIEKFEDNPSVDTLPFIKIELVMELDNHKAHSIDFFGEQNYSKKVKYGIVFLCKFNDEFATELSSFISEKHIPYEYYNLTWTMFSGNSYSMLRKPLEYLAIETSNSDSTSSFNYYNKSLFSSSFDDNTKMSARNTFRNELEGIVSNKLGLKNIDDNRCFGIDTKKVILESVLNVMDNKIPLENKGSGMENLIKTEIAMSKKEYIDVVSIEEPENHLSYSNMQKMLENITNKSGAQMIITTHNDMIATRLNLNNVMWLNNNQIMKFNELDDKVANFFEKAESNNLLHFILSEKVILVEGPTEYLLLPKFYEQITNKKIEEDKVSIISCNGISYSNYKTIAEFMNKKVSIITDNDKNNEKIETANEDNKKSSYVNVFMDQNPGRWTWEVCLYKDNKETLDELFPINEKYEYLVKGEKPETKTLGWMLNNKTDGAYKILTYKDEENKGLELVVPEYIRKAIEWVKE